jgi:hypothetical protein
MSAEHVRDVMARLGVVNEPLAAALEAREDSIESYLLLSGAQLGAMPGFVAKVLMDAGLGKRKSPDEKAMIEAGFARDMEELRRMMGEGS